eukprot:scaffold21767_cov54-Phaeocystis_antarctica.AAC.1
MRGVRGVAARSGCERWCKEVWRKTSVAFAAAARTSGVVSGRKRAVSEATRAATASAAAASSQSSSSSSSAITAAETRQRTQRRVVPSSAKQLLRSAPGVLTV